MKRIINAFTESISSILPIFIIVIILSISVASLDAWVLVMFLFGTILLILGMSFFTIGSEISMHSLGEGIGNHLGKSKKLLVPLIICFILGVLITIAEPDLQVLAEQVPSIPNTMLIIFVAVGVGIFLVISMIRTKKSLKLRNLLMIFYALIIALAFFTPKDFVPTAFDSGGVTTGPITVPFIMALGAGLASTSKSKNSKENSFGLIALCSIGPILSVLILSICFNPSSESPDPLLNPASSTKEAFMFFLKEFPSYLKEVFIALLPILMVMVVFQLCTKKFSKYQLAKMGTGFLYTYIGLVLFLTGANVGFMPAGRLIGSVLAKGNKFLLIPVGALMGYFVVSAEPAVHSLKKQVEEITNGAISQKAVSLSLSIGVGVSVAISMLRVITGISILPFLIVGYLIALVITFFVPPIYTGIAFDSGGVASGPMTTTFILPFAIGACSTLDKNIMTDAFGIVAMVAMTPLITIQILGLYSKIRQKKLIKKAHNELLQLENDMIYYEEV